MVRLEALYRRAFIGGTSRGAFLPRLRQLMRIRLRATKTSRSRKSRSRTSEFLRGCSRKIPSDNTSQRAPCDNSRGICWHEAEVRASATLRPSGLLRQQ
jgi:hypothetical protein